jgi:cytochrome b6-f complex iron-sulfur subunit
MTAETLVLIGIAAAAIAAAIAAFAIAWRRSGGPTSAPDWREGVGSETLAADRSRHVELPPVPTTEPAEEGTEPEETTVEEAPVEEPVAVAVATEQRLVEVSPEEAGVTRRQFFNRALGVTFGTFMGVLGLDFLAFLWPKLSGGFGADVNAGSVQDLLEQAVSEDGSVTPVFIPEARAYVVPAAESPQFDDAVQAGGVFALYQRCVHLGCRVPWCSPSQGFECPCHGSKYNSVGEYFAGPAPRNLDRFAVELTPGDELIIKTGTIIQTPRALQKSVEYPQGPSCIGAVGGGG